MLSGVLLREGQALSVSPKSILLFVCEVLPSPLVARSQGQGCLQAVKEIYEIVPARKWRAEEKQMNKIVFIVNHVMVII
ncbi:hypothetical protein WN944_000204 [Citrus x changshan-huyou]|uniref:Uncharacterized protein n=1 Tax=Citrus x changshan-huyou TaxID=2935761 RepID=A0AAP0MHF2_9ROSI